MPLHAPPRRLRRHLGPAALALSVLGVPAAAQDGHGLALTGPPSAALGRPVALQATGTVPADAFLNRYVNVYAVPASVVSSCPATYQGALQIKDNTGAQGGETVALGVPAEGAFSTRIVYTPSVAGRFLLCGYLHDLVETYAVASHRVAARAARAGGAAPRALAPPTLRRSGARLVCGRGRWTGNPHRYAYGWRVDGRRRAGATRPRLRITAGLRGRAVRCAVTATNRRGSGTALSRVLRVPPRA